MSPSDFFVLIGVALAGFAYTGAFLKDREPTKLSNITVKLLWFLFFTITFLVSIYNFSAFYIKYFRTDVIRYESEIYPKYEKFLDVTTKCDDEIIIYTKKSKWIPSAQIARCADSKVEKWLSGFSYSNELIDHTWKIKYEK